MEEQKMLALLLRHDEDGLEAALTQYGSRLHAVAAAIVGVETAGECVNDALLAAWRTLYENEILPASRPNSPRICAPICAS